MGKTIFESHNLTNRKIPFIFHFDEVRKEMKPTPNWHNNLEILYFTEGRGQAYCDGEKYDVKERDIFVINSNTLHGIMTDGVIKYFCLIVDNDFCMENGIDCTKLDYSYQAGTPESERLYKKIVNEINGAEMFREAGIKSAVLELIVYISRNFSTPASESVYTDKNINENVQLAIGYIKTHIDEKLTLEKIAEEVGLSKFHFSREFKRITGLTIVSYINVLRCRNAKKLLLKNEYSIHEIANKCGFENDSYFSRTFKKYIGVLPSEYIKNQNI